MTTTTYKATAFTEAAAELDVVLTVGTERRQILSHLAPEANLTLDFQRPQEASERI